MRRLTATAILLIGGISNVVHGLDLTPHEIAATNDGPPVKRYYFEDADKRLSFRIDNKMTVDGTNDSVTFRFSDIKGATVKLSKSQISTGIPFDQKNLEPYRSPAKTFLPRDATNVQLEEEKPDAIAINGWTSQQFIFTYDLFGFPYRRSVTFFNYSEKEQFILDVSAPAGDYEKAYTRGYRFMNSLSDLPAISTSGPT